MMKVGDKVAVQFDATSEIERVSELFRMLRWRIVTIEVHKEFDAKGQPGLDL